MSLQGLVTLNITRESATVEQAGFGSQAFFAYHTKHTERVLAFNSAPAMLQANGGPFVSTDLTYKAGQIYFAQEPTPSTFYSVRRVFPTTRMVEVTPRSGVIAGITYPLNTTEYSVIINGETFTFTTDATATVAEVTAGLTALINAGTQNVLATDNTTSMTIEKAATPGGVVTPGEAFTLEYDKLLMTSVDNTPVAAGGGIADEIAAALNVEDAFYAIAGDWFGKTEILAAATAVEALDKLHLAATSDDEVYEGGGTHIGALLQNGAFAQTSLMHHKNPELAASGRLGELLPSDPGSRTNNLKTIATLAAMKYTDSELANMKAQNVERYVRTLGRNVTRDGKTSSGEFIDTTRFVHWLKARICEEVFSLQVAVDKIPFTDGGLALIQNTILGVLNNGVTVGGLTADPAPVVNVPRANPNVPGGVSIIDKANRILNAATFCTTLAGAVHELIINGKVSD